MDQADPLNKPNDNGWCERLYLDKAAPLILYGRALGLSHGEAEDVLHETFVALLQSPSPPANPLHYCLRSYRNRALNYRRNLWRRLTRELESRAWFDPPSHRDPEEQAAIRALTTLPPEQREVIVLKIWHRCTFKQIGDLLDLSPNTVAGRYRYGLHKLKSALQLSPHETVPLLATTTRCLETAPPFGETP